MTVIVVLADFVYSTVFLSFVCFENDWQMYQYLLLVVLSNLLSIIIAFYGIVCEKVKCLVPYVVVQVTSFLMCSVAFIFVTYSMIYSNFPNLAYSNRSYVNVISDVISSFDYVIGNVGAVAAVVLLGQLLLKICALLLMKRWWRSIRQKKLKVTDEKPLSQILSKEKCSSYDSLLIQEAFRKMNSAIPENPDQMCVIQLESEQDLRTRKLH